MIKRSGTTVVDSESFVFVAGTNYGFGNILSGKWNYTEGGTPDRMWWH